MRITSQSLNARTLADLQAVQNRQAAAAREVATGRRVMQASDDPSAARDAIRQRSYLAQATAHRDAAAVGTSWTQATDAALGQVSDLVHRARELTVQGANSTLNATNRANIAKELTQITASLKDALNAKLGDRYLFGGTATTTPPYAAGSDAYAGDAGLVALEVGQGVSVAVNTLASDVLGSGQAAADGKLLQTLRDITDHLAAGDVAALGTTDLKALEDNLGTLTGLRASVGATQNRLDAADLRLTDVQVVATKALSDAEDVGDMAMAITRWNSEQSAYQAALQVSAKVITPSLLDFLR